MEPANVGIGTRLLRLIRRHPGLHLRELARELALSEALASYHLDHLEEGRLVQSRKDDQFRRFFPSAKEPVRPEDQRLLGLLRNAAAFQISIILIERGPLPHGRLVELTGYGKSTLSYHLVRLQEAGLVGHDPEKGFLLKEAKRVERLLLEYDPPEPLLFRFADLWGKFYRSKRT